MTNTEPTVEQTPVATEACRLCRGSGRIAVGPWGVNPTKKTCPECLGEKTLPKDHEYQDPTI